VVILGSDHCLVAVQEVVCSRGAGHPQFVSRPEALLHRFPEDRLCLWRALGYETPAGVQAVKGIPVKSRVGLRMLASGFLEELVEL
jgi:hypothetical protein